MHIIEELGLVGLHGSCKSTFLSLVDRLLGTTGLPWKWEGDVSFDHPAYR